MFVVWNLHMSAGILFYELVQEGSVPKCELKWSITKLESISPVKSLLQQIPHTKSRSKRSTQSAVTGTWTCSKTQSPYVQQSTKKVSFCSLNDHHTVLSFLPLLLYTFPCVLDVFDKFLGSTCPCCGCVMMICPGWRVVAVCVTGCWPCCAPCTCTAPGCWAKVK